MAVNLNLGLDQVSPPVSDNETVTERRDPNSKIRQFLDDLKNPKFEAEPEYEEIKASVDTIIDWLRDTPKKDRDNDDNEFIETSLREIWYRWVAYHESQESRERNRNKSATNGSTETESVKPSFELKKEDVGWINQEGVIELEELYTEGKLFYLGNIIDRNSKTKSAWDKIGEVKDAQKSALVSVRNHCKMAMGNPDGRIRHWRALEGINNTTTRNTRFKTIKDSGVSGVSAPRALILQTEKINEHDGTVVPVLIIAAICEHKVQQEVIYQLKR